MKITRITFGMLRVPLKTPFKTALRTVDRVEDIIVMVHTDGGNIGYHPRVRMKFAFIGGAHSAHDLNIHGRQFSPQLF